MLLAFLPIKLFPQTELKPVQETRLPVPLFRGVWWSAILKSSWIFSIQITPNQELLVYEPNKDGNWPLVRVRKWWMKSPETEVLNIFGWSSKEAKNLGKLNADLQVTPDGQYAVAFAEASWTKSPDGTTRRPDEIITTIYLNKWKVLASIHTSSLGIGKDISSRVLNNNTLVLKGSEWSSESTHVKYQLLSLPTLAPVCECSLEVPHLTTQELKKSEQERDELYAASCAEVLKMSKSDSLNKLSVFVETGQKQAPEALVEMKALLGNDIDASPKGDWYGISSLKSELIVWNSVGEELKRRQEPNLLCENQPVQGPAWDCSCGLVGESESSNLLLVYCLTQHDNLLGSQDWLKQWLSIFRTDDLSERHFVRLAKKNEQTEQIITSVGGRTYVLVVSLGEKLAIYEIPASPAY